MIYLMFSTMSSGSTFLQTEISQYIDVPRSEGKSIRDTEFSLLDWGAYFIYEPHETIDFEPVRTINPLNGERKNKWRNCYRGYLKKYANEVGRPFPDPNTGEFLTVEEFFLNHVVEPLKERYQLPNYDDSYPDRLEYVIDLFRTLDSCDPVFGKNPKWLNDFSGHTINLFDKLMSAGINIKGIYLYRCPADAFTSIVERKFRLDEMFNGDVGEYAKFALDSLEFSTMSGIALSRKYDFFQIQYELISAQYPALMNFMGVESFGAVRYKRNYGHRYVLNPRARSCLTRLSKLGAAHGYHHYYVNVNVVIYLYELVMALVMVAVGQEKNVNNPISARSILKRCFWYEVDTPKAAPLKRIYRKVWKRNLD